MSDRRDQSQTELAGLRAVWTEAERRLYPLVTTVPDLYVAAVRVVRAVADGLDDVSSHAELVERWSARHSALDEAQMATDLIVPREVPQESILGSAFALRDREVSVQREQEERREQVRIARAGGRSWAVLHERGDVNRGLADPYQCIELYLPMGLALVSAVEPNPDTAAANYVLSVVEMDGDGSEVTSMKVAGYDDRESDDVVVFAANRSELRHLIEQQAT